MPSTIAEKIPVRDLNASTIEEALTLLKIDWSVFEKLNPLLSSEPEEFGKAVVLIPGDPTHLKPDDNELTRLLDGRDKNSLPIWMQKALDELGTIEFEKPHSNPRIVKYIQSVEQNAGPNTPDDRPWCSAFLNWCFKEAGLQGTGIRLAKSWREFGRALRQDEKPELGDIVFFDRYEKGADPYYGHVGLFVKDNGSRLTVLGGCQADSVSIMDFPKDGPMGRFYYRFQQFRRPVPQKDDLKKL